MSRNLFSLILMSLLLSTYLVHGQPVNKTTNLNENGLLYFLPESGFEIRISFTKKVEKAGYFSDYCETLLNQHPEITEDKISYNLDNIQIKSFIQSNNDEAYVLNPEKSDFKTSLLSELEDEKMIFFKNLSSSHYVFNENRTEKKTKTVNYIPYESMYKDRIDTIYKKEFRDSVWVDVPYYQRKYILKTKDDHANEAANNLISLKYKLIKNSDRLIPEDEYEVNMSQALLNEINDEIAYLNKLFHGHSQIDTFTQSFILIPDSGKKSYEIAYFGEVKGLNQKRENGLSPIVLTLKSLNNNNIIETLALNYTQNPNKIYYKIPAKYEISISHNEMKYVEGVEKIYQYGSTVQLPIRMINGK